MSATLTSLSHTGRMSNLLHDTSPASYKFLKCPSMISQQRAGSEGKPVERCERNYLPFYAQVQILGIK